MTTRNGRNASGAPRIGEPDVRAASVMRPEDILTDSLIENASVESRERAGLVDATGISLRGSALSFAADALCLERASLDNATLSQVAVPSLDARRSGWQRVTISGFRFGATEFFDADLREVTFEHCKIDFLNLRGSKLRDVRFRACSIRELDLDDVQAVRVAVDDCDIETLGMRALRATSVDLRGARLRQIDGIGDAAALAALSGVTISSEQLYDLTPVIAAAIGLRIE